MTLPTAHLYDDTFGSLRLGLCQVHTETWDVEGNLERTMVALDRAAELGSDVAVTPECVLLGYPIGEGEAFRKRVLQAACPIDGESVQAFRELARRRAMHILVGFAERVGDRVYNSAAFISNQGEIRFVYRKVHCRDFESIEHQGCFTPGGPFQVTRIEVRGLAFTVGAMICFDREIPESVRCLRAHGAELVLCPLATNIRPFDPPVAQVDNESITQVRAAENELYIAVINHAGRFNGGSFVVGPSGEVVCQAGEEAGVQMVEIPLEIVARKFHANPWGWMGWGYRHPGIYRAALGRTSGREG